MNMWEEFDAYIEERIFKKIQFITKNNEVDKI